MQWEVPLDGGGCGVWNWMVSEVPSNSLVFYGTMNEINTDTYQRHLFIYSLENRSILKYPEVVLGSTLGTCVFGSLDRPIQEVLIGHKRPEVGFFYSYPPTLITKTTHLKIHRFIRVGRGLWR